MGVMDSSEVTGRETSDLLTSLSFRRTVSDEDYVAAVKARQDVDTAVGIFMGKHDCTQGDALAGLQRTASTFDITLLELAQALIASSGS